MNEKSCIFCRNTSENFIDICENALEIEDDVIEFSSIIEELFCKSLKFLQSSVMCEICKDNLIQFYILYVNVKNNDRNFIENSLLKCKKFISDCEEKVHCISYSDCLLLIPNRKLKYIDHLEAFVDNEKLENQLEPECQEIDQDIITDNEEVIVQVTDDTSDAKIVDIPTESMNLIDIEHNEITDYEMDGVGQYSCDKCNFIAESLVEYNDHCMTHTASQKRHYGKHFCDRCSYQFSTQAHYTAHTNGHKLFDTLAKYMNYPRCNDCKLMFIDESSLEIHLINHQSSSIESTGFFLKHGTKKDEPHEEYLLPENSPKCGHCHKKFIDSEELTKHLLIFHAKQLTCPIDLRTFNNNQAFTIHMRNNHPELFPNSTFVCSACHNEFDTLYDKLSHMKVCKEKSFNCSHCKKSFSRKCHLVKHLKLVSGELNITCEICEKVCRDKHDFKIHMQSHTTEKLFKCSLCSKSYKTASARAAHLQSHLETILCPYCNLQFKSRRTMQKHMKNKHERDGTREIEIY